MSGRRKSGTRQAATTTSSFTVPHQFENSLGKFYMAVLCTTLQQECGVGYNAQRKRDPGDASDSRDRFIHGITHGNGGTCASLPVLYSAVGRRLGYPLKIVQGARHLFLRWDETDSKSPLVRDRFNIEATAEGFVSLPDNYYELHPFPHPCPDVDPRYYLRSLGNEEELAIFLCVRSIVLMDNGQFVEAIQPAAWARKLAPDDYSIKVHLELTMLFALNLLTDKPKWMDENPVIRSDGVVWSRYWWPRPLPSEERDLLPAAKLPAGVLNRILPLDGPKLQPGDLVDALYERANHYATEECCQRALQSAMSQQSQAMDSYHHAIKLAKDREKREAILTHNSRHRMPWHYPHFTTSS
jgi:hypothetical protein